MLFLLQRLVKHKSYNAFINDVNKYLELVDGFKILKSKIKKSFREMVL